jgi:alpha-ribazole phosphatase
MPLWLARHAQAVVAPGVCYGMLDLAADAAATRLAAASLALALPPKLAVAVSPLRRCRQLADVLSSLRPDLAARVDPRLREMDFGTWEGRTWRDIGETAVTAWTDDFARHRPGGGESVESVMRRVGQALDEIDGRPTLWITHAGVIRAASLLARGERRIARAMDWPAEAPACGGWTLLHPPPAS